MYVDERGTIQYGDHAKVMRKAESMDKLWIYDVQKRLRRENRRLLKELHQKGSSSKFVKSGKHVTFNSPRNIVYEIEPNPINDWSQVKQEIKPKIEITDRTRDHNSQRIVLKSKRTPPSAKYHYSLRRCASEESFSGDQSQNCEAQDDIHWFKEMIDFRKRYYWECHAPNP